MPLYYESMVVIVGTDPTSWAYETRAHPSTPYHLELVSDARIELAPHAPKARMIPFHQSEISNW